jgi:asparagine synthase (glutamine-hydrolysing)
LTDLYDSIDTTIRIQEEPFLGLSIGMQYYVMKEAKQAGVTVLLDGQGGDETLLGNIRYYATSLKGLNVSQLIKSYLAIARNSELSLLEILAYKMYFTNFMVRNLYIRRRSRFVKKDYQKYCSKDLITEITQSYQDLETLQNWEMTRAQLPKLLLYEDKNSMHFSIEARVPYLDHELVETALSISPFHRIHKGWTKYPLREIAKDILPAEIAWRKHKFGFEAPQKAWISKYKQSMIPVIRNSDLVNRFANLKDLDRIDTDSLWKLYNMPNGPTCLSGFRT